jgi:ATP-independent RNA helicase DbpA
LVGVAPSPSIRQRQAFRAEGYRNERRLFGELSSLDEWAGEAFKAPNMTLVIEGGKKDKIRAGDILGALTGDAGIDAKHIGKIDIYDRQSYVAIARSMIGEAFGKMKMGRIKGKRFPVWMLQ